MGTGAKPGPAPFTPGAVYWDCDLYLGAQPILVVTKNVGSCLAVAQFVAHVSLS